mgnify:CR=1 FL=1
MPIRLILGPLRGITHFTFRNVFTEHFSGFDTAMAPFIPSTRGNKASIRHFRDILPENNCQLKIIPQLLGKDPDDFIRAACQVHELGYDCVNWNLGCPMPTVTRKIRGSALLAHPDRIRRFLDRVIPALPCGLSIKTRLGYESPDDLLGLIPSLNAYPLTELIIHPRTAPQMYTPGTIDLERFAQCLESSRHQVVYNGDITNRDFFITLQRRFPSVSSWMIGRGAVANPFLAMQIKQSPLPFSPAARIRAFHDQLYSELRALYRSQGPVLGAMKELWKLMQASFYTEGRTITNILRAPCHQAYEHAVEKLFSTGKFIAA